MLSNYLRKQRWPKAKNTHVQLLLKRVYRELIICEYSKLIQCEIFANWNDVYEWQWGEELMNAYGKVLILRIKATWIFESSCTAVHCNL